MQWIAVSWLRLWRKKFFFSAAERSFDEILRRTIPDYIVFAKVRLCDVISACAGTKAWRTNHDRIQKQHLDFLICDATLAPVMAIELDGSSHKRPSPKVRDQFVEAALAAAAVPIVRIPAQRAYALDDIRRLIFPQLHGSGPIC